MTKTRNYILRLLLLMAGFGLPTTLPAQTVQQIIVSQDTSYTDHVTLKEDARDMDLMVKFIFDEEKNTLTVNLISYRSLFVFRDNVRYKPTIGWKRSFRPDKLPYVVNCAPKARFRISKEVKNSIPKPRKKHVFNRWIEYDVLQPIPQEYNMVNDFISQSFDIPNKQTLVKVKLRDVYLMDDVSKNDAKRKYEISYGHDLNREYQVHIKRNPCFGKEEDIKSAAEAVKSISTGYASMKEKFGAGTVKSQDALKVFNEMHDLLTKQFPYKDIQSECPDVQRLWKQYNLYTDSISSMSCVVADSTSTADRLDGVDSRGIMPRDILSKAKQIDRMVSRWLSSKDIVEKRDLIRRGEDLITDGNTTISSQGVYSTEQRQAVSVFQEAVRYFNKICKQGRP